MSAPYRIRSSVEMFHPALYGLARLEDKTSKNNPAFGEKGRGVAVKMAGRCIYGASGPAAIIDYLSQMALYPSFAVYSHVRTNILNWKNKEISVKSKLLNTTALPFRFLGSLTYSGYFSVKKTAAICLELTFIPTIYRISAGNHYTNLFFADRSVKSACATAAKKSIFKWLPIYNTHTVTQDAKKGRISKHNNKTKEDVRYEWNEESKSNPNLANDWLETVANGWMETAAVLRNITEIIVTTPSK